MKRKEFLKTSSVLITGAFMVPMISCNTSSTSDPRKNWGQNYTYKSKNLHTPGSLDELKELVNRLGVQKALGSKHCFNGIADSPLNQISLENLRKIVSIDRDANTVTVEGGMRYGDLAPLLEEEGLALHNLASLPHISVVGASATATHGSGVTNGNLASGISGLEFITGTGEIKQLTREDPEFAGAVVHLGALGIVSQVTLDIQPTYQVRQDLFQDLPFQAAVENFEEIMSAGYSVSLFTDWMNQNVSQIWIKRKVEPNLEELGPEYFGATAATRNLHPITRIPATACTEQMGVPGPWYDRLPHFKMGFLPSSGNEIQSEFFVPREHAVEAFQALERKKEIINPPLQISEVRTIAKDNLWLSPAYQKDVVAFHFTWKPDEAAVRKVLPVIEQELAPFGVLPHWGKLFTIDKATLHSRYPKMKDFLALVEQFDPERKFKNEYLKKNLYES